MKQVISIAMTLVFALVCVAQPPQGGAPANAVNELKARYNAIKTNITKMAEKMPEENYSFKAAEGIRTFGELMNHIALAQMATCTALNGEMKRPEPKTSKADTIASLKESFDACDAAFNSLTDANALEGVRAGRGGQQTRLSVLWGVVVHSNEEYGYGSIYLRLKGITPPSSEPRN